MTDIQNFSSSDASLQYQESQDDLDSWVLEEPRKPTPSIHNWVHVLPKDIYRTTPDDIKREI